VSNLRDFHGGFSNRLDVFSNKTNFDIARSDQDDSGTSGLLTARRAEGLLQAT
jgi:hypothetical protein